MRTRPDFRIDDVMSPKPQVTTSADIRCLVDLNFAGLVAAKGGFTSSERGIAFDVDATAAGWVRRNWTQVEQIALKNHCTVSLMQRNLLVTNSVISTKKSAELFETSDNSEYRLQIEEVG